MFSLIAVLVVGQFNCQGGYCVPTYRYGIQSQLQVEVPQLRLQTQPSQNQYRQQQQYQNYKPHPSIVRVNGCHTGFIAWKDKDYDYIITTSHCTVNASNSLHVVYPEEGRQEAQRRPGRPTRRWGPAAQWQ